MDESSVVSIMFFWFTLTMVVWCKLRYLHCLARRAWDNSQRDLQHPPLRHATQCSWASLHRFLDRISHGVSHTVYLNSPGASFLFFPLSYHFTFINPVYLFRAYFAGPLNDKLSLYLSHRNSGFREPEFRLWAFIPTSLILPGGLIIYGTAAVHGLPWIVPAVGMGMVGFGISVGGGVTIAYILECYRDLAGEVVTTIILIRNIIGFGITFGVQPWIDGMGLQNTFVIMGSMSFAITGFSLFFICKGGECAEDDEEQISELSPLASRYASARRCQSLVQI